MWEKGGVIETEYGDQRERVQCVRVCMCMRLWKRDMVEDLVPGGVANVGIEKKGGMQEYILVGCDTE